MLPSTAPGDMVTPFTGPTLFLRGTSRQKEPCLPHEQGYLERSMHLDMLNIERYGMLPMGPSPTFGRIKTPAAEEKEGGWQLAGGGQSA
jgi:hypothetical protein